MHSKGRRQMDSEINAMNGKEWKTLLLNLKPPSSKRHQLPLMVFLEVLLLFLLSTDWH